MPKVYAMVVDNDIPTIQAIDTEKLGTATIGGTTYWLVPMSTAATAVEAGSATRPTVSSSVSERHGTR